MRPFAFGILKYSGLFIEEVNSEHPYKIRCSGEDLHIFWNTEPFLSGICLLPWKMMAFFFIFNKLTGRYRQWRGKLKCSVELISFLYRKNLSSQKNKRSYIKYVEEVWGRGCGGFLRKSWNTLGIYWWVIKDFPKFFMSPKIFLMFDFRNFIFLS